MVSSRIVSALSKAVQTIGFGTPSVELEFPQDMQFGDFTTSIAMKLFTKASSSKGSFKTSRELADSIVALLQKDDSVSVFVEKIEVAGPGFINFFLSRNCLHDKSFSLSQGDITVSPFHMGEHKKIMVEFGHANTHKPFHIGHLRNITIAESIVRMLEAVGNTVIRANYEGDVGLHIAKCLWALQKEPASEMDSLSLSQKIELLGKSYVTGNNAYEDDDKAREEIKKINTDIYNRDSAVYKLWKETREWSLQYFDTIYQRVGSHFDRLFFESEVYERSLEIAKKVLEKGILEKSEGAIVFSGEKCGLHTRVFVTKEGNPTYEGKDLGLAELETSEFGLLDKIIHIVDVQQTSYFQVLFKVLELIDEKRYKNTEFHFAYGFVTLKEGRMSSRKGTVILGEWLLNEAKKRLKEKFTGMSEETAEKVAVGAVKYSLLKVDAQAEIAFDMDQSITLEGNSGPYLQYTYARIHSVLQKVDEPLKDPSLQPENKLAAESEQTLLRLLTRYETVVYKSATLLKPDQLANYLYELSKSFNAFYQHAPILSAASENRGRRITVSKAAQEVLGHGLHLLGIPSVVSM